jgi:hypothetical protein
MVNFRSWRRLAVACAIVIFSVGICAYCALFAYSAFVHFYHQRWYRAVENRILALAELRPKEVSSAEWAFYIYHTWNLHANHGGVGFESASREKFLSDFDERLKMPVDAHTIDWIWDEYLAHTNGGAYYSQHYRPTKLDRLQEFRAGELGEFDLQEWLARLAERRAENQK